MKVLLFFQGEIVQLIGCFGFTSGTSKIICYLQIRDNQNSEGGKLDNLFICIVFRVRVRV